MVKKGSAIALLLILVTSYLQNINAQYPSDSATVYLLTASPGDETYSAFGHSAIRISDPIRHYDVVYNYGTFDFSTPNFYLKFINGKLLYCLSKAYSDRFLSSYQEWGQAIYQQKFNLTNQEKWQLINNLEVNFAPENRYYRYSFFYDNCATRIRDMLDKSTNNAIVYDSSYVKAPRSFRQLMEPYMKKTPWMFFGMNIILGKPADKVARVTDYTYLPEHLKDLFASSMIKRNDVLVPVTEKPVELFPTTLVFEKPNPLASPIAVFCYLFFIIAFVTIIEYRTKLYLRWVTYLPFVVAGIISLLLLFLQFNSLHHELHQNYNLLWANPLALILAVWLIVNRKPKWLKILTIVYLFMLLVFVLVGVFGIQSIPGAIYPFIGILVIRAMTILEFKISVK